MTRLNSKEYLFKELDEEGMSTLEAIVSAPAFNEWMYKTTSRGLSGKILEVGSGIGNISEFYLRESRQIVLSDIRDNYCDYLKHKFQTHPNCEAIINLNLVHPGFDEVYKELLGSFDGLFALNVIEHIKDDKTALINAKKLLKSGGKLVILVPAYQFLFNQFDIALEHYRRYNSTQLTNLFEQAGIQVNASQYFNLAGILGWFVSGKILRKKVIPVGQMKFYNLLVPIFKLVDKVTFNRIGLSVLVYGTKQ